MATKLFLNLFRRKRVSSRKRKTAGFTLLELLISMLIGSLLIVILLNLVIDLLQTDRREYARTETQREMQMAMDFIVNDIREAVYVYGARLNNSSPDGAPPLRNFIPIPNGAEPILAFWKPEPIDAAKLPDNCSDPVPNPEPTDEAWVKCRNLRVKRRTLNLVVYYYKENITPLERERWKGISRIIRYELPQYDTNRPGRINVNNEKAGYLEPLTSDGVEPSIWPFARRGGGSLSDARTNGSPNLSEGFAVLVDFLDHPKEDRPDNFQPRPTDPRLQCPPTYAQSPPQSNGSLNRPSFAVCVSEPNPTGSAGSSGAAVGATSNASNQEVIVFLRGNPTGKAGVKIAPLLAIKTQAVARGVIDKTPVD
jgi:prepilin-type N-terminal cleavage/methylation domain-containing protein